MARRTESQGANERGTGEALAESVMNSAQSIWLAGLGAFERARNDGDGVFNGLVEQGKVLRERAREAADLALKTVRNQAELTAGQAQGQIDRVEQIIEERLARSLNRLGVLSREEMEDLGRQVRQLNESVQLLLQAQAVALSDPPPRAPAKRATRKAAPKAAVRKGKKKKAGRGAR
jgi:poly(hydroxyalkanoate) granule-associated protein